MDQVDPQYAYRMLVPVTWEAVDGGDRRIYRSPGEPDAPDRLTIAVINLKITGEAAKALGGMLAQYAVFERSPTLDGWTGTYFDEAMGDEMTEQMSRPFDLLLGRKTFDIFASYWPQQGKDNPINKAKKYVASSETVPTAWEETIQIDGDVVVEIEKLKQQDGPMLQVHGSSELIQILLQNDLVDELKLKIFPVTLGKGKRLFGEGTVPAAFKLTGSKSTPSGVIIAAYQRDGEVRLGSFS